MRKSVALLISPQISQIRVGRSVNDGNLATQGLNEKRHPPAADGERER